MLSISSESLSSPVIIAAALATVVLIAVVSRFAVKKKLAAPARSSSGKKLRPITDMPGPEVIPEKGGTLWEFLPRQAATRKCPVCRRCMLYCCGS